MDAEFFSTVASAVSVVGIFDVDGSHRVWLALSAQTSWASHTTTTPAANWEQVVLVLELPPPPPDDNYP